MEGFPSATPRMVFAKRRQFYWKSALLAATTLALIPILLWKHEFAATLYVAFLVVVHVGGLAVFAYGVSREDLQFTRTGLWVRLAGVAVAVALLYLASKGLRTEAGGAIFWSSLFAIWGLHTGALLLLHLRGREMSATCPFV